VLTGRHGDEQIRQGLEAWHGTGARLMRPHFLALIVDASVPTPHDDSWLDVVEDALTCAESTGERYYEAELHRLKGELLLHRGPAGAEGDSAEACFERALAVARQQNALSLELRAALSLARFHHRRGNHARARDLVAPVYERFHEGFDTVDLRDARSFLDLFQLK
jgi:predicted ATPase